MLSKKLRENTNSPNTDKNRSLLLEKTDALNNTLKEEIIKDKTPSTLSIHLKNQKKKYGISETNVFSSCKTTTAFSPR